MKFIMYVPEDYIRLLVKDFMPRLKDNSIEAVIDVMSKRLLGKDVCNNREVTRQSLDKNIKSIEDLVCKISRYKEETK
jgi:hypothetical protein